MVRSTANNPMGVHHAAAEHLKIYFNVLKMPRVCPKVPKWFDCQGLWVEVEVEKEANFQFQKTHFLNFGLEKFYQRLSCPGR